VLASLFGVLVKRLVSVIVKCLVKDQQVGSFCSSIVSGAIIFFSSVGRIKSMDSSSTKDMDGFSGDFWGHARRRGQLRSRWRYSDGCFYFG